MTSVTSTSLCLTPSDGQGTKEEFWPFTGPSYPQSKKLQVWLESLGSLGSVWLVGMAVLLEGGTPVTATLLHRPIQPPRPWAWMIKWTWYLCCVSGDVDLRTCAVGTLGFWFSIVLVRSFAPGAGRRLSYGRAGKYHSSHLAARILAANTS
jgi:hypothetical protein